MRDVALGPASGPSASLVERAGPGRDSSSTPTIGLLRPLLQLRRSLSLRRQRARGAGTTEPAAAARAPQPLSRAGPRRASSTTCTIIRAASTPASASASAACEQPPPPPAPSSLPPLDEQHLADYLARHCPQAQLIPRDSLTDDQASRHVVKSIVLSAKGLGPILAVARLADRLDERAVAAHLGLARRAVRLATPAEALEWSGYVVGTVPPVGHRTPLRTLFDVGATRAGEGAEAAVYAGGGRGGVELRAPLAELLRASCAEVGAFAAKAVGDGGGASTATTSSSDEESGGSAGGPARAPKGGGGGNNNNKRGPPPLPLPWPPGSDVVRLVATVSSRRRVARLLMFATLVPEEESRQGLASSSSAPASSPRGGALGGGGGGPRPRGWARPEDAAAGEAATGLGGAPVEVQVIAGKTLERALGADALARLLASVRPGCVVSVTGRVQRRRRPRQQQSSGDEGQEDHAAAWEVAEAGGAALPSSTSAQDANTLDVVASGLEVLHASAGERDAALRAAEARAGLRPGALRTARDLLALRRAVGGEEGIYGASATSAAAAEAFARTFGFEGNASKPPAAAPSPTPPVPCPPQDDDDDEDDKDNESDGGPWYRLPFPLEYDNNSAEPSGAVALVRDLPGVEACAAALRAAELEQRQRWAAETGEHYHPEALVSAAAPPVALSSRFLLSSRAAVVGIDAEWMPFGSSSASSASDSDGGGGPAAPPQSSLFSGTGRAPRSPVALLQIALRDRVFLLDLPALIGGVAQQQQQQPEQPPPADLTPAERAVDALLAHLLSSPWLVKAGFGLAHDLKRLADSYPRLPSFAPEPSAPGSSAANGSSSPPAPPPPLPLRSHVDLPLLARAVLPALAYKDRPLGPVPSLSRLCEAALGGVRLDKRQQRSAWERRPLNRAQVRYAAADAHVLTSIFDALVGRAASLRGEEGGGGGAAPARLEGEAEVGAAVRALDGGLRRVPRAKPPVALLPPTTTSRRR